MSFYSPSQRGVKARSARPALTCNAICNLCPVLGEGRDPHFGGASTGGICTLLPTDGLTAGQIRR
jgi:hypothetical protein